MKRNILISFLSLLLILSFGFGCYYNKIGLVENKIKHDIDPLQDKFNLTTSIRATVALSRIDKEGDQLLYCTGVFVGPTTIVTARHCVVDHSFYEFRKLILDNEVPKSFSTEIVANTMGKKVDIVTHEQYNQAKIYDIYPTDFTEATVVYLRGENLGEDFEYDDLIILRVAQKDASKYYVKTNSAEPSLGDRVYSIGMPQGMPFILSDGIISSDNFYKGRQVHNITNMLVAPGCSGSPLLNTKGELIGLGVMALIFAEEGQSNLGLYLVASKIEEYLNVVRNEKLGTNKINN